MSPSSDAWHRSVPRRLDNLQIFLRLVIARSVRLVAIRRVSVQVFVPLAFSSRWKVREKGGGYEMGG